ncbi:MAG: hypothetical protein IV111_07490, partial [Pseudomonas sp.]|nr:hypothetical protein [Pseudomonas sp.]
WRPADVAAKYPLSKPELSQFVKFEVPLSGGQKVYAGVQFALYLVGGTYLLAISESLTLGLLIASWAWVAFGLYSLGVWLENRPWARLLEVLRLLSSVPLLLALQQAALLPVGAAGWSVLALYALVSALWLWRLPASAQGLQAA